MKVNLVKTETAKMTKEKLTDDIWGAAFDLVEALIPKTEFLGGGYTIIMSQYGLASYYGYICMVSGHFVDSGNFAKGAPIISNSYLGKYFFFETRR